MIQNFLDKLEKYLEKAYYYRAEIATTFLTAVILYMIFG